MTIVPGPPKRSDPPSAYSRLRFPPDAGEGVAAALRREREEDREARYARTRALAWLSIALSAVSMALAIYTIWVTT